MTRQRGWTEDEENTLRTLWRTGAAVAYIANELQRTVPAVKQKRLAMNLPVRHRHNVDTLHITLPADYLAFLKDEAGRKGITLSGYVRGIIEDLQGWR